MKRRRGPSSVVFGSATIAVTDPSRPTSAPQHSCGYVSCPCARIAASTSAVMISARPLLIERPETFVEIFFAAVRKDGRDDAAIDRLRHVEHRRDGGARGNPGEHPLLAREA